MLGRALILATTLHLMELPELRAMSAAVAQELRPAVDQGWREGGEELLAEAKAQGIRYIPRPAGY
jgi:hypothetical protein